MAIYLCHLVRHLLFTQIGAHRLSARGTRLSKEQTMLLRRFIAENSHRHIISDKLDLEVTNLYPRRVDKEAFNDEKKQWDNWHKNNSAAEKELLA